MSVAIKIESVSKLYRLGTVGTGTLSHDLNRWWHQIRGKEDPYAKVGQINDRTKKSGKSSAVSRQSSETAATANSATTADCQLPTDDSQRPNKFASAEYVWALRDINLEVAQGEILGIIGRNGAGKSTLLKLLSRVTAPTTGAIKTKGRIASLLEVGTGFHPDLTGRENIYMNGAILGMRRDEISKQLDEIVDFSGCAKYLDTPVKRYSSGMTVRLGFAVAAHLQCETLIVDEVLAVGDVSFQQKCLGKMNEVANSGCAILFVSHSMSTIRQLTNQSVVLNDGEILFRGSTEEAVDLYVSTNLKKNATAGCAGTRYDKSMGTIARFMDLRFRREDALFGCAESLEIAAKVRSFLHDGPARFSFTLFRGDGTAVGSCFSRGIVMLKSGEVTETRIVMGDLRLAPGTYYFAISVGTGSNFSKFEDFDSVSDVLYFEVARPQLTDGGVAVWQACWGAIQLPEPVLETVESELSKREPACRL